MKKPRETKRRKRLEGEIDRLAVSEPDKALELSQYGRYRTDLEKHVSWYLWAKKDWIAEWSKLPQPDRSKAALHVGQIAIELCEKLTNAAAKGDIDTLQQFSEAVRAFRFDAKPAHKERYEMLHLKAIMGNRGLTHAQIAKLVKEPKEEIGKNGKPTGKVEPSQPNATLIRLARKYKFSPSKTGRPKR